nr:hypothetical protein [Tanacetum cinerariifolium]
MPVCENSPVCDDYSEIFSDSNNDDDISSDEDAFEDIEYVEASLPDPEIVSVEEGNVAHQQEEEFDLEEIQDVVLREKLLSINRLIANIKSLNDNPTPDHTRSGNTTTHADDSLPEYDSFCFKIEPDQERLINVVKNDISDDSSNDPLLEEADLFIASDNSIPPGIKNCVNDSKGDIRYLEELLIDDSIPFPVNGSFESDFDNPPFPRPPPKPPDAEFDLKPDSKEEIPVVMNDIDELQCLEELLIDDSIPFPVNESFESDFDNPSFQRPPPEPPDAEFDLKPDSEEEIPVVMNDIDELECFDPRDDDDYSFFMFVIYSKVFSFLLSAESEDTIFDPGFTPHRLKFLVFGYLSRSARASHPFFEISLGKSISLISIALPLFAAFMLRLVNIGDNV